MKSKKWIQKSHIKKGALHRQLKVPEDWNIPVYVLKSIKKTKIGDYVEIERPFPEDYIKIKVTPLLKKRVQLALNMEKIRK